MTKLPFLFKSTFFFSLPSLPFQPNSSTYLHFRSFVAWPASFSSRSVPQVALLLSTDIPEIHAFTMSSTIPKPKSTAPLSLAGKPPYATDEPDSFYETPHISPSQRIRAQLVLPAATANSELQNKRTSAYDVYVCRVFDFDLSN